MARVEIPWDPKLTGNSGPCMTVVSRTFAKKFRLFQTGDALEIRGLGATYPAEEYAASVSFPGTALTPFDLLRLRSADFVREPNFACLIGRDILQHWTITFDGRGKVVVIDD